MREYYEAIDEIKSFLERDLIGPISTNETLKNDEPLNYYAMGMLWPMRKASSTSSYDYDVDADEDENIEDATEVVDDGISNSNKYKPSTMGLTFAIPSSCEVIDFTFSFAKYTHEPIEGEEFTEHYYTHNPMEVALQIDIPTDVSDIYHYIDDEFGIKITLYLRKIMPNKAKLVSISVSNTAVASSEKIQQNTNTLFQSQIKINSKTGFVPVYMLNHTAHTGDDLINDMLYKDVENYAYGHGCSTHFDRSNNTISSEFMPCEKVYQMMPNSTSNTRMLSLKFWCDVDVTTGCKELVLFVEEYKKWLDTQIEQVENYQDYKDATTITFDNIRVCIDRLTNAVNLLSENKKAFQSFVLMNEAMLLQRVKTKRCSEDSVSWYPFQLAYILQVIPDIVHEDSKYRDYVDLLWFPTGGGKTEAYLGVAGFTIFYSRLTNKLDNDGVTVFMRYTLRLLTIQQFERSASLICACEFLRKKYNFSSKEISIGLFIGRSMTPNSLREAKLTLENKRKNSDYKISESNPMQLDKCPWCGSLIDISCYNIDKQMTISCKNNPNCDFYSGFPIYLIDDDVYLKRPTLVLGTIDKFARITWEERAKNLFDYPIKLVIQDELHLISGPLGSLSGIYEIAVDALSKVAPKVIASTATVKMAQSQIKSLYNKEMLQFPPNGLSAHDSFFAVISDETKRPARTYLGLCELGGSVTDLMVRVYANLLFLKELFKKQGKPDAIIDHFYTTVGYFNAIKDLGASSSIISDRVNAHVQSLIKRKFKLEAERYSLDSRNISWWIRHDELTSRKSSTQIKETLTNLEKSYDEGGYSYVLASNMLSVGIDINRLGVMTVYNQPKSNSEYIQATSRVGRQNPGLVLMMYNSNRSRDKSHYEQFSFYHKSFYRYVEATSVTPFSTRAIEKALHCVFIALVRHTVSGMQANEAACNFRADRAGVESVKEFILKRVRSIYPTSEKIAEEWLDAVISEWEYIAINNPDTLVYYSYNEEYLSLLISNVNERTIDFPLTLNSLRNVEESSNVYLKYRK